MVFTPAATIPVASLFSLLVVPGSRPTMLRANYTEEEKSLFHQLRYSYPDERVMRRFEILWLHTSGKFVPEIAVLVQQNDDRNYSTLRFFAD